jgi:uncharacterized protein (DUF305 family)
LYVKRTLRLAAAAACLALSACASRGEAVAAPDPHAHHDDAGHTQPAALPASDGPGFTAADVRFMQDMIGHHAQALTMTALAPARAAAVEVLQLAEKIDISQRDEIDMMKRWLVERRQAVPADDHTHAAHMPGMLTQEQLAQLAAARGPAFDRLFLRLMIQHHEGAVHMVETLFASPGAAQDSDIFRFATDVEADQRDEIDVMSHMLDVLTNRGGQL